MNITRSWRARHSAFMNRVHAARAGRKSYSVDFTAPLDTLPVGDPERGRQIFAGRFVVDGRVLDAGARPWDLPAASSEELQSFSWLDDLLALGDGPARAKAQTWLSEWVARYGKGLGWTPETTARRLWHWQGQMEILLPGMTEAQRSAVSQAFARQLEYLVHGWAQMPQGPARLQVLAVMVAGQLALEDHARGLDDFLQELRAVVKEDGAVPSRRPEELLTVFAVVARVAQLLRQRESVIPSDLSHRLAAMGQVLRGLRHGDGGLVRFHGGGAGQIGLLDAALFAAGLKGAATQGINMGFARLAAGRMVVMADAAPAPQDHLAHASALGLEVSIGRRPLIVSCGDGSAFGEDWQVASRAPASHSVLVVEGGTSLTLRRDGSIDGAARKVLCERSEIEGATRLEMAHDAWSGAYGLVHARQLDLVVTGRSLEGEDLLMALTDSEKHSFDRAFARSGGRGIGFALRFHLHPDVVAMQGEQDVTFVLKSGEVWALHAEGAVTLSLEASVYLEKGQPRPRTAQQVVLTGHAMSYATRIRWRLTRAHETSDILRARQPN